MTLSDLSYVVEATKSSKEKEGWHKGRKDRVCGEREERMLRMDREGRKSERVT